MSFADRLSGRAQRLLSGARIAKFLGVGAVGAAVDTAVLTALVELASFAPLVAKLASVEASIVVMFALNEHWTFARFGDTAAGETLRRFFRSNAVRAAGAVVGIGVFAALHATGVWYLLAHAVGLGLGFGVNYVCESLFTWEVGR